MFVVNKKIIGKTTTYMPDAWKFSKMLKKEEMGNEFCEYSF